MGASQNIKRIQNNQGDKMKTNRLFWKQHQILMECFVSSGMSAHEAFHEAYKEMKKA